MSKEWKLVPVELTEAMREAYEANSIAPIGPISKYGYRAMLDAAPVTEIQEPAAWIKPDVLATLRGDECCYAFGEQSPKGNLVPLFTRSDAGELERLRAELGECKGEYDRAVNKVDALRDQLTAMCNLWPEDMRNEGPGIGFMQHVIDTVNAARSALPAIAKPACKTCHDQGEVFVSKGKVEYGMLTEPDPIYAPCPDCADPANKERAQ